MPFSLPFTANSSDNSLSALECHICELQFFTTAAHDTTAVTLYVTTVMLGLLGPTPALYAIVRNDCVSRGHNATNRRS